MNSIDWKTGQEFIDALFDKAEGFIEFRFIGSEGRISRHFVPIGSPIRWKLFNYINLKGENLYLGVCPRKDKTGTKQGVSQIRAIWCDIDGKDFCKESPQTGVQMADALIKKNLPQELTPSIRVNSGNGFHLYWLLSEPVLLDDPLKIERFEGIMLGLASLLKGDHCFDVSRILRLPGSFNVKNPARPKPCVVVENDYSRRYNVAQFDRFFQKPKRIELVKVSLGGAQAISNKDLDAIAVSPRIRELVRAGKQPGDRYKSRSEADFAVVLALAGGGCTPEQIYGIYMNTDWKIGDKCRTAPDPIRYLEKTIGLAKGLIEERKKKAVKTQTVHSAVLEQYNEARR